MLYTNYTLVLGWKDERAAFKLKLEFLGISARGFCMLAVGCVNSTCSLVEDGEEALRLRWYLYATAAMATANTASTTTAAAHPGKALPFPPPPMVLPPDGLGNIVIYVGLMVPLTEALPFSL